MITITGIKEIVKSKKIETGKIVSQLSDTIANKARVRNLFLIRHPGTQFIIVE